MTALRLEAMAPPVRYTRAARSASQRRIARHERSRYATLTRISATVLGLLVILLSYVVLTSNITALSYSVDRAHQERSEMQAQVARYDDDIASLTSDDRLAAVAARLGMVQPDQFVRVTLVPALPAPTRPLAFLAR